MTSIAKQTFGTPEMKSRQGESGIHQISTKTWIQKNLVQDPEGGNVCWSGYSPQQRRDSQSQSDSASQSSQSQGNDTAVSPSVMLGDVGGRRKLSNAIMPPSKKSKSNFGRTRSFEELKSKNKEAKKQKDAAKGVLNNKEDDSGKGPSEIADTSPEFPEMDDDDLVRATQEAEEWHGSSGAVPETTPKRFIGSSRMNNRRVNSVQSSTSGVPATDRRENIGLEEISLQSRLPVSKPVPISCNDDDDAFLDGDDELFSQVEIPDA